jgi:hypothetical protein
MGIDAAVGRRARFIRLTHLTRDRALIYPDTLRMEAQ